MPRAEGRPEPRSFSREQGERDLPSARDDRSARYERAAGSSESGGTASRAFGQGGDTSYGQMASGSSDSGLGGYSGADVGGWGQPNLNSQSGQGGYAPLNQGLDYGQDGGRFRPLNYDAGPSGRAPGPEARGHRSERPQDHHEASYHSWRESQLAGHDRDYARWRDEQVRRYDEDYGSWRNERHSAFSKEFEGWRAGRGGQAVPASTQAPEASRGAGTSATVNPSEASAYGQASATSTAAAESFAHGANPTLAKIADGADGHHRHAAKPEGDKDGSPH